MAGTLFEGPHGVPPSLLASREGAMPTHSLCRQCPGCRSFSGRPPMCSLPTRTCSTSSAPTIHVFAAQDYRLFVLFAVFASFCSKIICFCSTGLLRKQTLDFTTFYRTKLRRLFKFAISPSHFLSKTGLSPPGCK